MTGLLRSALGLAEKGIPVFALRSNKKPCSEGGFKAASTDPAVIRRAFADPLATRIGVPTGAVSGLDAVDVDPRHGGDVWLGDNEHRLPAARRHDTSGGGMHLLFKHAPGMSCSAGRIAAGVDVRADSGYIVWHPAQGHGVSGDAPADWPDWLLIEALRQGSTDAPVATPEDLVPPDAASLLALLAAMPNPESSTRDDYTAVNLAIQGCVRSLEALGRLEDATPIYEAAAEWAARWDDAGASSFESELQKWADDWSQRDNDRAGWRQLLGLAGRLGADIAPFALAAAVSEFGILPPEPDAQRVNGAALRTPPITFHRYQRDNNPYGGQRWLIHGMLPETGVAFLAGMYGSGKTFVGLDMAVSVVSGAPFAGYDVERQGGVLFLAAEGAAEIPVRLRARLGSDVDQIPFLWRDDVPVMLAPGGQSALVAATVAAAAEFAKEGLPLSLVILDTIAAAAGWTNENDAAEAAAAIRVLKAMADAAGCLVLAIDHHGKTAESGQRGSSAKAAGAESVLSVLCDREQNGTVTNRRLALHKVRAAPAGREVSFDLQQVTIGEDVKGRPVTTCVVDWQDRGTTATVDRMSRAATAALGILGELIEANRGEPVPENTWRDECEDRRISAAEDRKSRSRAFTRAFEGLRDTGRVLAGAGLVGMKPRAAAEFNDTTVVTFAKGTGDKRGTMSPFAPCHPPHMGDKGPMGQGNVPFVPLTVAGNLNLAQSELRQLLS